MSQAEEHMAPGIGRKELVVLLALLMALHALAIDGMLPALDDIAHALNVRDPNQRQYVVGLFLLATGAGALVPGLLALAFMGFTGLVR